MSRQSVVKGAVLISSIALTTCAMAQAKKPAHPQQTKYISAPGAVYVGDYLYQQTNFDGSELLTNTSGIREASRLLSQENTLSQRSKAQCATGGDCLPPLRLQISGYVEGSVNWSDAGKKRTDLSLSGSELDFLAHASKYAMGFIAIDYNNGPETVDPSQVHSGHQANINLNRAFVVLGNFASSPFYGTIGQAYTPFGRYSSAMISSPMTKILGRVRAPLIELGYTQQASNSFHTEAYVYQGQQKKNDEPSKLNRFGFDAGYNFNVDNGVWTGKTGIGWLSNLADSEAFVYKSSDLARGAKPNSALDAFGGVSYTTEEIGSITLYGEYVTALSKFKNVTTHDGNNGTALNDQRPSALDAQLTWATPSRLFAKPLAFTVAYGHSAHAGAINGLLNKDNIGGTISTSLIQNTSLALQYMHSKPYSGDSANSVAAQFDLFF